MTGAELKAWRERLGKDKAWIEEALDRLDLIAPPGRGYGSERRRHAEGCSQYAADTTAVIRAAYRAALEAEEARQAAERAQAEPVCPEGVYTTERHDPSRGPETVIRWSSEETELFVGYRETEDDVKAARFYLELVTYRARQRAEGDRQRKLDAVRAAEDAWNEARKAHSETSKRVNDAHEALTAARREAGL